jgi:hypothetical protein
VDLVEEEHLALGEGRKQRGEIAGALDRGTGGDAQRRAELGRDDHRESRLAESGRARKQDVVRRPTSLSCGVEDERELFADALLPDELAQPFRSQRRLDDGVVVDGFGGDDVDAGVAHTSSTPPTAQRRRRLRRLMLCSACGGSS